MRQRYAMSAGQKQQKLEKQSGQIKEENTTRGMNTPCEKE